MKPVRRVDSTSQSCSCTSCLYKSESEQPSIRKYVAHGSRIDRLYYGKYIPLRERKLLNRLVRTRAVYDDLRARLISDSTLSLEKNADLRPGKHQRVIKNLDAEKSGAILEIVDIIDKGGAIDSNKLSDCCSCCSCSSKSKIIELGKKEERHKKGHGRTHGQTRQIGKGEGIYTRELYEREYGETVPGKMRHNKRGVRFKAKHIRSDPCTCTFKFSGLIKEHSKAMLNKIRPPPPEEPYFDVEQYIIENSKKQNFATKSLQKYKDLQDKVEQDMRKLNESRAKMKKHLQLRAKKSLEQGKKVKDKMKHNIESGVRKSIQAIKALHAKDEQFEYVEYPELENNFKIKKDSIVKFKDYLKKKELMKDWECDLECEPTECVPEECFKIIKLKRHKRNRQRDRKQGAAYEMVNRESRIGGRPVSKSNSSIQAAPFAFTTTTTTHIKKQKPMLRAEGGKQFVEKRVIIESKDVKKGGVKKGGKRIVKQSEESAMSAMRGENSRRNIEEKDHIHRKDKTVKEGELILKKGRPHSRGRQAVRIKSSFSFDLEFYKNRPQSKISRSSHASGIHMYAPRHKGRKVQHVASESSLESSQSTPENVKTTLTQTDKLNGVRLIPQQAIISQCECKKRLSNVKISTQLARTRSVSSLTSKSTAATTDKIISKEVKQKGRSSQILILPSHQNYMKPKSNESNSYHKQAVRIGSTFSFNVEFYKKSDENNLTTSLTKETVKQIPTKETVTEARPKKKVIQTRTKNKNVRRKLVQVKDTSAKAYNQAKYNLHRCFCTLKSHGNIRIKRKDKIIKATPPAPVMVDKNIETKKYNKNEAAKLYRLLPNECEPGICVPGECDPTVCKKIIDLRKGKRIISKSVGSHTGSRKTRSTSSIVSRPFTPVRAKIVQSSIVSKKVGKTGAPRRYKQNLNLGRDRLNKTNIATGRQAVRIGSSFSFNIEFYKDNQNPAIAITEKPSFSKAIKLYPNIDYQQQQLKDKNKKKHIKSMFTQVINMDKYVGPSLKRCLCTLQLYKNKAPREKKHKKDVNLSTDTQTYFELPIEETVVDKGTRTKKEHQYKLLPYECEPYTCIPGECDPYLCLQKIKRRELNTRNISAFTDKPETKSVSSLTESSIQKSEAILVQPKFYRKGTGTKAGYIKAVDIKPRPIGETFTTAKSRQAVRIGSNFNFTIEFSKQMPGLVALTKHPKKKQSSKVNLKTDREKGITVTKIHVNHVDTQSTQSRKVNRASLVRPILKRCFCTLNLQKKTKRHDREDLKSEKQYFGPKTYTIGRVMTTKTDIISHSFGSQMNTKLHLTAPKNKVISISTSSFLLNKYIKSLKVKSGTVKLSSAFNIPSQLKQPVLIKSNISMKVDVMRKLSSPSDCKSLEFLKLFNTQYDRSVKRLPGISRYLEQCFCTMNVHISKPGVPGIKDVNHKLLPYECEPGICIPGECNPYECKKLIMKRLAKNVETKSTNPSTNKSTSSYATSRAGFDSKSTQMQARARKHAQVEKIINNKQPQETKPRLQQAHKQKQAVRLKSSFSFDLEFYKSRSEPPQKYVTQDATAIRVKKPTDQKVYKAVNTGVQGKKFKGKDATDQPIVTTMQRGTVPMTKRCFCTLKLQKKGRIHREQAQPNRLPIRQAPVTDLRDVKIGTAIKYPKVSVNWNDLKFYECEPGICVPGKCDPYKCLEIMKHRKDLGINTLLKQKASASSMTSEEYNKTRAVGVKTKKPHHKSIKTTKYVQGVQNESSHVSSRNSRPAVRIGSNFSFNIEFFKDMPQEQPFKEMNLRRVKKSKSETRQIKERKKIKVVTSPSNKSVAHKIIETQKIIDQEPRAVKYTENRAVKVPDESNPKTFKNRCFCLLGLRDNEYRKRNLDSHRKENKDYQRLRNYDGQGQEKKTDKPTDRIVQTIEKPTNTNYKHKVYKPPLEPYECEPGVCIPGQCDPYLCEKLIQQRISKQYSKKSETESVRTQSTSSNYGNYKRAKNEKTQARAYTRNQGHVRKNKVQEFSKRKPPSGNMILNADKRLVRIGSNFSFNIEFFKENVNNNEIKEKIREVKDTPHPTKNIEYKRKAKKYIAKNIETERPKELSVHSEKLPDKKIKKATQVSPLLKRCFCTLKLMNKPKGQIDRPKKVKQPVTKPVIVTKTVKTQSKKRIKGQLLQNDKGGQVLSPYECEPFVCVPGECDPVECLKRIKRRQQQTKEFGTITNYPKRKSIGNVATRTKDENLQVKHHKAKANKVAQKNTFVEKFEPEKSYQPRQCVRIGSNFSFNIEFFKDTQYDVPKGSNRPSEELDVAKNPKKISQQHRKTQQHDMKTNVNKQIVTTQLQTTGTETSNLKRCFCTLAFKNKKINNRENIEMKVEPDQPKSDNSNVGNFVKRCFCTLKLDKVGKRGNEPLKPTVKYQIKATSTDGRRLPQIHNIKNPIKILEPYECEPYFCVPGECDPYECLKRIQQRQVRDFGTDYKRNVKDSATDSIKQPMTRSTKAQYRVKRKLHSKGTSLTSKRLRHSKEATKFSSNLSDNTQRQVVRIGSNFSFNVEFFKDQVTTNNDYRENKEFKTEKMPNVKSLPLKRVEKIRTRSRESINTIKRRRNKKSQNFGPRREAVSSEVNIAPKRCFCTLKLLKRPNHPKSEGKLVSPHVATKDKMTGTKVKYAITQELGMYECPPGMCIPGECNPYECLDKIKKRQFMQKSRNVGTLPARTSIASVGNRALHTRNHKFQTQVAKRRNVVASTPCSEPQSEILKSSPAVETSYGRNKRAVRIGSNFNFSIDFFKQKSQPAEPTTLNIVKGKNNEEEPKLYLNKNVTAVKDKRHYNANVDNVKLKDQASDAGNALKRCFCTLQLQKPTRQKMARVKIHHPGNNARYPQTFTVGRVQVEPFKNNIMNSNPAKKTDKARSTSMDHKLLNKTVGTKTDKKYLRNLDFPSSQCNPSNCPDYQKAVTKITTSECYPSNCPDYKKRFFRKRTENDMKTILPYTPSKFNKKESKTCVSNKNKFESNFEDRGDRKLSDDASILNRRKRRLTAKKSSKSIPRNALETKSDVRESFFCRCVRFFSRGNGVYDKEDHIKNTNKRPDQYTSQGPCEKIKIIIPPKKTKSYDENCPYICPENKKGTRKIYPKFQSGDVKNGIMKTHIDPEKSNNNQSTNQGGEKNVPKRHQMRVTFADSLEYTKNFMFKRKINKLSTRPRLCYSCSVNDCPLKNKNLNLKGELQISGNLHSPRKTMKSNKRAATYSESVDDCQYCDCCKRKIDSDEISKGAGDRHLTKLSRNNNTNLCPCGKKTINGRIKPYTLHERSKTDNVSRKYSMKRDRNLKDTDTCPCGKDNITSGRQRLLNEKFGTDQISRNFSVKSTKNKEGIDTCPCGRETIDSESQRLVREHSRPNSISQKFFTKRDKCCQKIKPSLEIKIDSLDHVIINKGEVKKTIDELNNINHVEDNNSSQIKTEHGNLCICCKCMRKREKQGAKISVAAKGPNDILGTFRKLLSAKKTKIDSPPETLPTKFKSKKSAPCICGSKVCAMEVKRKKSMLSKKQIFGKSCVCGSAICAAETKKIRRKKEQIASKANRKAQSIAYKKARRALNRRVQILEAKDEIRRLKRIKRNKELEKRTKKYKGSSDVMLAVDNLIDVGRLGLSSVGGVLHYSAKTLKDPKASCESLCRKCRHKDPESILQQLANDYTESDTASTLRRLKMRCSYMQRVQSLKEKLEGNRFTHFLLHLADKNPKTRRFKRRPVRHVREPLDFQCSLYMATLRKRPYLSVYYKWPWFYPHFLTMVNIWRQFTDIMLFLLAAVVWSPCILCMEGCRALMCCFFCTG